LAIRQKVGERERDHGQRAEILRREPRVWAARLTARLAQGAWRSARWHWASAVRHKFLDVPLTKEQIAEFIQIPPR